MNQQYLKQLQQRAQRLLQISSEEENQGDLSHIQTIQNIQSSNKIKNFISIYPNKGEQLQKNLAQYKQTDIQLLKKCILLTTQNNRLKIQLQKQKQKNQYILNQIKDYKIELKQSKKIIGNLQKTYRKQLNSMRRLQTNEQKIQYQQKNQKNNLKSPLYDKINGTKQQIQENDTFIIVRIQRQLEQYKQNNEKLKVKLQNFKQQNYSLKKIIQKEKHKFKTISDFIHKQIPKMKDSVDGLTSKIDFNLEKVLLNNFEVNYH